MDVKSRTVKYNIFGTLVLNALMDKLERMARCRNTPLLLNFEPCKI